MIIRSFLAFLFIWSTSVAAVEGQNGLLSEETNDSISEARPLKANICFGGLEHGKLIPNDGEVSNQWKETSELGCQIDGGRPSFLPDLAPAVPEGRIV